MLIFLTLSQPHIRNPQREARNKKEKLSQLIVALSSAVHLGRTHNPLRPNVIPWFLKHFKTVYASAFYMFTCLCVSESKLVQLPHYYFFCCAVPNFPRNAHAQHETGCFMLSSCYLGSRASDL